MSIHGIDVSQHQGSIDWRKVKASGIQFAMLRAGYGASTVDGEFERNARGCMETGIPFGVYWFSYAYTPEMARREAEKCISVIREYKVQYRYVMISNMIQCGMPGKMGSGLPGHWLPGW